MQNTLRALVVMQARGAAQLLQHAAAVGAQAHDLPNVVAGARGGAFAQELQAPEPLAHVGPNAKQQRRVFFAQPLQHFERRARVGPWFGMAHRNLATVGKAGFSRRIRLAVHHGDLMAELGEVIRGADAKQAAAEDENFHLRTFGRLGRAGAPKPNK